MPPVEERRWPTARCRPSSASAPRRGPAAGSVGRLRALARVDDAGRVPRLGLGVHPGEVEVVAAPVAGSPFQPTQRQRRDRAGSGAAPPCGPGLRSLPGAALVPVGDDVGGEADRVLAVRGVGRVGGVAVGDEDVVAALHPADVRQEPAVDLLAREAGDVTKRPPPTVLQRCSSICLLRILAPAGEAIAPASSGGQGQRIKARETTARRMRPGMPAIDYRRSARRRRS